MNLRAFKILGTPSDNDGDLCNSLKICLKTLNRLWAKTKKGDPLGRLKKIKKVIE
jgi:hypothetical protein